MSYGQPVTRTAEPEPAARTSAGERLSLGVAARLSRYLQVLTQARKMGKETISSQELSDYTHVRTQIRRVVPGSGKFGKRGVGYNVEALVSQIRLEPLLPGLDLPVLKSGHYHPDLGLLVSQQRPLEDLNL